MHPTADTKVVMLRESLGAAGDAGRYVAILCEEVNGCGAIVRVLNWSCFLAAFAVPAILAVKLFKNAASAEPCRGVIYRATIAFAVWVLASAALLFLTVALAYISHGVYLSEGWQPTPGYFGVHLTYLLIGCGLVYWVWRQERIELP